MTNFRVLFACLSALCCCCYSTSSAAADASPPVKTVALPTNIATTPTNNVLRIGAGIREPKPPYTWVDECTGKQQGYLYHLMLSVFDELEIPHRRPAPVALSGSYFQQQYQQLVANEIDVSLGLFKQPIPGILYSKEPVVIMRESVVYSRARPIQVDSINSLSGKRGLTLAYDSNTTDQFFLARYQSLGLSLDTVATVKEGYDLVLSGRYDYIISEKNLVAARLNALGLSNKLAQQPIDELSQLLYLAASEKSPWAGRLGEIDRLLEKKRSNGHLAMIFNSSIQAWLRTKECSAIID